MNRSILHQPQSPLMLCPRRTLMRTVIVAGIFSIIFGGCQRRTHDKEPANDDMATMPGMSNGSAEGEKTGIPDTMTLSAEQIAHGGIRWAAVRTGHVDRAVQLPGGLVANDDRTVVLSAPTAARVVSLHVRAGDHVERGQALVTLQSADAAGARADEIKAQADVVAKRAAAVYARTALERAERLLAIKAIPRQDVERAQADDEAARAMLAQAEAELARTHATIATTGPVSASGAMVIRAPFRGVILSRVVTPGAVVDVGTPLVSLTDPSTLWLTVAAPGDAPLALRVGSVVHFTVAAYPNETFQGRVASIGGALDPVTRTLPLRATVDNHAGQLRPEMFATVVVETGALSGVSSSAASVVVPDSAIQMLDSKLVVFVVRPGMPAVQGTATSGGSTTGIAGHQARFERRNITLGGSTGGQTEIVSGVAPGEQVVTNGAFAVKAEFAKSAMPKMEM